MSGREIEIKTKDGVVGCHYFEAGGPGRGPGVIFFMDGIGIRPALVEMAGRYAANGYCVLLPNMYYRAGAFKPFEAATAFRDEKERERLMPLLRSINNGLAMEDTGCFLDFLEGRPEVTGGKVGCVGYCLGGAFALTAAGTYAERVGAAGSFHGARLATDQGDSPHLLAGKMKGGIYVGVAGIDPHFTAEERERLRSALEAAGVEHRVEVYPEVMHGFAVNDTPVYDRAGAEVHWERILGLFKGTLGG